MISRWFGTDFSNDNIYFKINFVIFLVLPQLKAFQPPSPIEKITFYTEIYPPANYLIGHELKGISVDTLKAIWKNLDIPE
jgi:polar amino acid transport system substrate-binding protein